MIRFGAWDVALLVIVTAQAGAIAYLHQPRWKVLAMSLPLPFTLASMALGKPVGATHAAGIALLLAYVHGVRLLHRRARVPIVAAIVISALAYALIASAGARVLPTGPVAFWIAAGVAMATAITLHLTTSHHPEPGHRSPLPPWIKLPIIAAVICTLIASKQLLSGFMAVFPMLSIVTAYEARHSLWAVCRQLQVLVIAIIPMMATVHLAQDALGLGLAIMVGWISLLVVLLPMTWKMWFAAGAAPSIAGDSHK